MHAEPAEPAEKKWLCVFCAFCVLLCSGCGAAGVFRQYEYEEEMYLGLDGTATVYVNTSIPALNALRGTSFDTNPSATVDRDRVRAYYSSADTHVTWVRTSRRAGRRFVHVRLEVDDVRRLAAAAPFAWSTYAFGRDGDRFVYRQAVGASAGKDIGNVGWSGREIVAFRMHLPSKIESRNTTTREKRGNILVWEQPLADRLRSKPLELDASMQTESILSRTMWLFGITFLAVAIAFALVIWWVLRRGGPAPDPAPSAR
jgi:hypothetical protein